MQPLWTPSQARAVQTDMHRFMKLAGKSSYDALHAWSIDSSQEFWNLLWDFAEVRGSRSGPTLVRPDAMPGAQWFPEARLNFADNLLRSRDASDAVVFWGEERIRKRLTHGELYDLVSRLSQALAAAGVRKGDRVAGYLPNLPESLAAMLATAGGVDSLSECKTADRCFTG
jgi:acetoacetyl-CoA synthetase